MKHPAPKRELVRGLGLLPAVMIVAGSMIGSGIFRKPAVMASQLMSPELLIFVWILAGLITFIGAIVNAEIAGFIDGTGGQLLYFKEMYGDFTAYLFGWSILAVIQTGSQAAIAYVFSEYLGSFIKYPQFSSELSNISVYMPFVGDIKPFFDFGTKSVAIITILFLTGINYIGVIVGGRVNTIVTSVKIASIIILSLLLLVFGAGNFSNIYTGFSLSPAAGVNIFAMIGLALSGAFWAYDGWNNVTYVAGEVKEPQKNIPKALFLGTLIVILVYVIINIAYLYVLPVNEMAKSPLVAATTAQILFGNWGAIIISIAVIISTFGALNGSILSTARIPFAMSRNNMFFEQFGRVHPKFRTPHVSLALQGIWSCFLVLSGTFDTITDYVIFAAWLFYLLGAAGVFILRKKMPDAPRPYKVWGYPYTPALFVVFSFVFLINSIVNNFHNAMMGLILILMGVPFYIYIKFIKKNNTANE
jgi:APA family basic amino acid/polyamine antiporter